MTLRVRLAGALLIAAMLWMDTSAVQNRDVPQPPAEEQLVFGAEMTGVLTAAGATRFRIALNADDAIEIQVSQPGVDVRLRLVDEDGVELARANHRRLQHGPERLHAIANSQGAHLLHVEVPGRAPTIDTPFTAEITSQHPAGDRDRMLSAAAAAYVQAETEAARGGGEAIRTSLTLFRAAAAHWKAAGAAFEEATALNRIGGGEMQLSNLKEALVAHRESLRLRREIGDEYGVGVALNNLAATHNRMGDYQNAATLYDEALEMRRKVGDRNGEGWSLIGAALVHATQTQSWTSALQRFQQALTLMEQTSDERGVAEALYYIAYGYKQVNDFDNATEYFEKSLALRRKQNDIAGQASILSQVAAIHLTLGDPQRALEVLDDTLPLRRRASDRRGEGYTLQTIGVARTRLGEFSKAVEHLSEAFRLFEAIGDREGQTSALTYSAGVHAAMGNHRLALDTAERARQVMDGRRNLITTLLLSVIGDAQLALKQHEPAAETYAHALAESRRLGEALPAAKALAGLGRVSRAQGKLEAARRQLLEAIDTIESVRAAVAQSELRASFLGASQGVYEAALDTLVDLHRKEPAGGYAAQALVVSERRRARSLLETLAEARADLRPRADATLLEREDALQRRLTARSAERVAASAAPTDVEREINELVAELRLVRSQIRTRSPSYAAMVSPLPLDLAGIQRLLDRQTVLLEYSLGEQRSYVWAITPSTITFRELPGRGVIEAAVTRARDLMTASARRSVRAPMRQALADVSGMILGPVARELAGKRLAIVADGVLQYVPFAALPQPSLTTQMGADQPLIVRHEIVMLPSASTLDVQRQTARARSVTQKSVAVLADPVLQSADPRVRSVGLVSPSDRSAGDRLPRDLLRAVEPIGISSFERLPYSGDEAAAIAAKAAASASLIAVGFDATRELAMSPVISDYRVVHFATHTVLDSRHPELSGIVLTLVDRQGQPINGFLRLHEIFNLRLSAEVVVLSGCQTALGREIRGEGLIGLTRGFMYAGASQVIASLWNVRDRATATLMKDFYEGLLERGLTPSAALRAAQVSMLKKPEWRMPVYWAGFVVQGDWRAASN